jgi:ubiquinone/menaquinone biosynthesis C-methylase UbiE
MFEKTARFYDVIYSWKDYEAESKQLHELICQHKKCEGNTLLEVACGTGAHVAQLCGHYTVEGLDLDPGMVAIARERCPGITFHEASMVDFDLGRSFDAVTCLFSSIGYVRTVRRMRQAIQTMADHLEPGGVLIVEPWFAPDEWNTGNVHSLFVDQPDLKIARMNVSEREGNLSFFVLHYLVGTPEGVEYFTERHELGLFTKEEYLEAFRAAGLNVTYDDDGLMGRGLYVGVR